MLKPTHIRLLFLGFLSLSASSSFALVPEWNVYRDVFLDGGCPRIIKELGSIKVTSPGPHGDFWSKSMLLVGKCLLKEQQPVKAKKFFLLSSKGAYPDAALYHLTQANLEAGEKSKALEYIAQLLKQPKHKFYLARVHTLLRENFKSDDEKEMLFRFLSKQRENPKLLLKDAVLHQIFMTQSDKMHQPVAKELRLLGWMYPEDVESAKMAHKAIWPTDFQDLSHDQIKLRVRNLQKLNLHQYLGKHLLILAEGRDAKLRRWLGNAWIKSHFKTKHYKNLSSSIENGELGKKWRISNKNLLYWNALIKIKRWKLQEAVGHIESLKKIDPKNSRLPFLYFSLAKNYKTRRRPKDAHQWLSRLIHEFPKHHQTMKAHWEQAWKHYTRNQHHSSLKHLDAGLSLTSKHSKIRPQFIYWKAKIHALLKHEKESDKLYGELLSKYANTYYGLRGLLEQEEPEGESGTMKILAKKDQHRPGQELSSEEEIFLNRWEFLFDIFDTEQAEAEILNALKNDHSRSFSRKICELLNHYEAFHTLQKVIANHYIFVLYDQKIGEDPLWEFAFPRPYWAHVREVASKAGIDPYFALAIMREESHFNPNAISRSEAMGLMQLMPATAKEQAGRHKIQIRDLEEIFDPFLNTLLGTHYLGKIASRFNDELVYTAGGYNAGPTNMKRWLKTYNGASPEEFVEHIPFQETREYVKRVYRSYQIYLQIYSS